MSFGSYDFDRHPGLTPLVIDLIPDQTRAEIEATIDAPLSVERWPSETGTEPPAAPDTGGEA